MRPGSVLTSVDVEPEYQRLARSAFLAAGFPASRYRLIGGRALEVLPRLADGAYDLVFCDADRQEYPEYLTAALRLLRPGGVVAFDGALPAARPAGQRPAGAARDSDDRDPGDAPEAAATAQLREQVKADDQLVPLLLPIGSGLLAAVKRG